MFALTQKIKTNNNQNLRKLIFLPFKESYYREITNNLKPRYTYFEYSSKSGDNYKNIIII